MKCYYCGMTVEDDAKFCTHCGKLIEITEELVDRARTGEEDAWTELYYRTCNAVYGKIRSRVPDDETALDLMQDTYQRAFTHLGQLNVPAAFPGWILVIASNLTVNWYKRRAKNDRTDSLDESYSADELAKEQAEIDVSILPEPSMDRAETARLVREILDAIPEEQKIVVMMRYMDQMALKDIAQQLDLNLNTVKSRLKAGEKKVEIRVRELEKQGTKLYSLAPLPFLLWLLYNQDTAFSAKEVLGASFMEATGKQITGDRAPAGSGVAQRSAAPYAKAVAATGIKTKIAVGVLTAALAGGGIAGVLYQRQTAQETNAPDVTEMPSDSSVLAVSMVDVTPTHAAQESAAEVTPTQAAQEPVTEITPTQAPQASVAEVTPTQAVQDSEWRTLYADYLQDEYTAFVNAKSLSYADDAGPYMGCYPIYLNSDDVPEFFCIGSDSMAQYILSIQDGIVQKYTMDGSFLHHYPYYQEKTGYFLLQHMGAYTYTFTEGGSQDVERHQDTCYHMDNDGNITQLFDGSYESYTISDLDLPIGEKDVSLGSEEYEYGFENTCGIKKTDLSGSWEKVADDTTGLIRYLNGVEASATAEANIDWKGFYADYIKNNPAEDGEYDKCYLIYLNDDDIPELFCAAYSYAKGVQFLYIQNGTVRMQHLACSVPLYQEKSGYLYVQTGQMGYYTDNIYYMDADDNLSLAHSGQYEDAGDGSPISNCTWDGAQVSAEEYENNFQQYCGWYGTSSESHGELIAEGLHALSAYLQGA